MAAIAELACWIIRREPAIGIGLQEAFEVRQIGRRRRPLPAVRDHRTDDRGGNTPTGSAETGFQHRHCCRRGSSQPRTHNGQSPRRSAAIAIPLGRPNPIITALARQTAPAAAPSRWRRYRCALEPHRRSISITPTSSGKARPGFRGHTVGHYSMFNTSKKISSRSRNYRKKPGRAVQPAAPIEFVTWLR
jgi:hypothetical protein